ncbi:GntR family transcriptional regulator [Actinosynnema sp. NPDC050436]|uniref:GntR family transcriptional regulator n=1 Tax=Actinosynnema sp. NPDC050436 TaxID=3155659 RepID=UPI00341180BE
MRYAAPLTVPVDLDPDGGPLPGQLAARLHDSMLTGRLPAGARLPSTRTLAAATGVSRGVAAAAYDLLTAQGCVHAIRGSGTFVAGRRAAESSWSIAAPPAGLRADPVRPRAQAWPDLRPGQLCVEAFPRAAWRAAWRYASSAPPPCSEDPRGAAELRHALTAHLIAVHGLRPAHLVVTTGRGAGLRIAADALVLDGTSPRPIPPGRAVVGDFSGLFGPALRVGYAVDPTMRPAEQPSHVAQVAVARLLDSGAVASTMRRRARLLSHKKSIVDEVLTGIPLRHGEPGTVEIPHHPPIGYGHLTDDELRAALLAVRRTITPRGRSTPQTPARAR